jgi:hypothetical protein
MQVPRVGRQTLRKLRSKERPACDSTAPCPLRRQSPADQCPNAWAGSTAGLRPNDIFLFYGTKRQAAIPLLTGRKRLLTAPFLNIYIRILSETLSLHHAPSQTLMLAKARRSTRSATAHTLCDEKHPSSSVTASPRNWKTPDPVTNSNILRFC